MDSVVAYYGNAGKRAVEKTAQNLGVSIDVATSVMLDLIRDKITIEKVLEKREDKTKQKLEIKTKKMSENEKKNYLFYLFFSTPKKNMQREVGLGASSNLKKEENIPGPTTKSLIEERIFLSLRSVERKCKQLFGEKSFPKYKVDLSLRGAVLGTCNSNDPSNPGGYILSFNLNYGDDLFKQTVVEHEFAHMVEIYLRGNRSHDGMWSKRCIELGGNGLTRAHSEGGPRYKGGGYRYTCEKGCSKVIVSKVMHGKIQRGGKGGVRVLRECKHRIHKNCKFEFVPE